MPKPTTPTITRPERIALALGFALLIVGLFWVATAQRRESPPTNVKQQSIPVDIEDFRSDPAVYDAIQKQLGNSDRSAPTPQIQQGPLPQNAGASLQPTASDLQAR